MTCMFRGRMANRYGRRVWHPRAVRAGVAEDEWLEVDVMLLEVDGVLEQVRDLEW